MSGTEKNHINLKIYEFILNDYPKEPKGEQFITTSIKSSDGGECGYIGYMDPSSDIKNKINRGESIRSCDLIDGIITQKRTNTLEIPDINMEDINFNLRGISSTDLITFSFHYPTKIYPRSLTDLNNSDDSKNYLTKVGSMNFLYKLPAVYCILDEVKEILKNLNLNDLN